MRRGILLDRRWLQAPGTRFLVFLLCLWQVVAPNWHVCDAGFAEGLPMAHCGARVQVAEPDETCPHDEFCSHGHGSVQDGNVLGADERFQGLCLADYLQTFPSQTVLPFQLVFSSRTVGLPEFAAPSIRRFCFQVTPLSRGPPEF